MNQEPESTSLVPVQRIPVLPLRDVVVYPHMAVSYTHLTLPTNREV